VRRVCGKEAVVGAGVQCSGAGVRRAVMSHARAGVIEARFHGVADMAPLCLAISEGVNILRVRLLRRQITGFGTAGSNIAAHVSDHLPSLTARLSPHRQTRSTRIYIFPPRQRDAFSGLLPSHSEMSESGAYLKPPPPARSFTKRRQGMPTARPARTCRSRCNAFNRNNV